MPPNFQIDGYSPLFWSNAGGRFFSLTLIVFTLQIVLNLLLFVVSNETLEHKIHELLDYIQWNFYIRFFEILFLDLCVSMFLNLSVISVDGMAETLSVIMSVFMLLIYTAFNVVFLVFVVRRDDANHNIWLITKASCLFDGYNLKSTVGKIYILVPYLQKLLIAQILVNSKDAGI
jgi:hypothetical protein